MQHVGAAGIVVCIVIMYSSVYVVFKTYCSELVYALIYAMLPHINVQITHNSHVYLRWQ